MFDGDEAGQKAAERAAVLALSNISSDLSARFCILPSDYDPDDFYYKIVPKNLRMHWITPILYQNLFGR